MVAIDSLCVLVEVDAKTGGIERVIRSYESGTRAEEDLELLRQVTPQSQYRIDDITHIER